MQFVVITGPSGAGKTLALHSLEDAGYYTVDNLPPPLLPAFIAFCIEEGYDRGSAVIDTRSGRSFSELADVVEEIKATGQSIETLYLDAGNEVLIYRFKETRRPHPLIAEAVGRSELSGIVEAVEAERERLTVARGLADTVMDTSAMSSMQLRDAIYTTYAQDTRPDLRVTITSFGFKFRPPYRRRSGVRRPLSAQSALCPRTETQGRAKSGKWPNMFMPTR